AITVASHEDWSARKLATFSPSSCSLNSAYSGFWIVISVQQRNRWPEKEGVFMRIQLRRASNSQSESREPCENCGPFSRTTKDLNLSSGLCGPFCLLGGGDERQGSDESQGVEE